jgi:DNA-binding HxlR family transcriptional regulator
LRGSIVEKQRAVPVLTFDHYGTPKSAVVVNGENRRKVTSAAVSVRRRRHLERVERWSLLILRDALFGGVTHFSQFQKSLGIATNVLAKRLEDFVAVGLMERRQPAGAQAEYLLTQKGLELKPVIIALTAWGDKWLRLGPVVFRNESDGRRVELQLRCTGNDAQVAVADVVARRR